MVPLRRASIHSQLGLTGLVSNLVTIKLDAKSHFTHIYQSIFFIFLVTYLYLLTAVDFFFLQ